jgi:hypothetical protein
MKKLFFSIALVVIVFTMSCNGQPKNEYQIYSGLVAGATKYHFFMEKKSQTPYSLVEGMDYLSPNVTQFKVGEASIPIFDITLVNDGAEYTVGVVAENISGYYSGMGTGTGVVGVVPATPQLVGLRRK